MANEFVPVATGGGANVESQATYLANPLLPIGNQPGIASSAFNNKALRQSSFVTSQVAQLVANLTGTDAVDNGVQAQFLSQLKAAIQAFPPQITSYLTGSGNHSLTYIFAIATGNATAGATYTNNAVTFTVQSTVASGTVLRAKGASVPAVSGTLTKTGGTGDATLTFYAFRAPLCLFANLKAGGGGGGAQTTNNGTTGGDTTFGIFTASGGVGGAAPGAGGAGGSGSLGGGVGLVTPGSDGATSSTNPGTNVAFGGGSGGGRGGHGGYSGGASGAAAANTGGGGGGASGANATPNGAGGGEGGDVQGYIPSPTGVYAYGIGAGGAGGSAGGIAGGAAGSGYALITECYQ